MKTTHISEDVVVRAATGILSFATTLFLEKFVVRPTVRKVLADDTEPKELPSTDEVEVIDEVKVEEEETN